MLFIIALVNVVWLHFIFFLQKLLWNALTGRSLCCCREKRKFGTSESQYFSWSIHREQRSGEKTSVIEIAAPMIVARRITSSWIFSLFLSIYLFLSHYLSLSLILSHYYPLFLSQSWDNYSFCAHLFPKFFVCQYLLLDHFIS